MPWVCTQTIHSLPLGATEFLFGEFDPGSERTLAAWIRHASRTISQEIVAEGLITRG